jgi:hypothetical protein
VTRTESRSQPDLATLLAEGFGGHLVAKKKKAAKKAPKKKAAKKKKK